MAYALVDNIEYLLCSKIILQDVHGIIEACTAGMESHNRVCAMFWNKWGPVLCIICWASIHILRAVVLVGLGLLENIISILNGLVWLATRMTSFLDHLLDTVGPRSP